MEIEFDAAKNEWNIAKRGLSFERVAEFDFSTAVMQIDGRRDYGEIRYQALGVVAGRVHALCFAPSPGGIRVISFRKANPREVKRYERTRQE